MPHVQFKLKKVHALVENRQAPFKNFYEPVNRIF